MAMKKTRNLKVYYKYDEIKTPGAYQANQQVIRPTIVLKGKWLEELGFEVGQSITVYCEEGKLVITNR